MGHLVGLTGSVRLASLASLGFPVAPVTGRGAAREAAICQAVIELLNEASYQSVTMDAVAAKARASQATIYRRWANKNELVIDALQRMFSARQDVLLDTGSLREDIMARIDQQLQDPVLFAAITAAMKALVYAASSDQVLADALRAGLRDAQLHSWQTVLERAHLRGELGRPVDPVLVFEVAQGQFCARTSINGEGVDLGFVTHIVDDVLMPVIMYAGRPSAACTRPMCELPAVPRSVLQS